MQPTIRSMAMLPYKSVAIALLYTVLLGPIGLLYASFRGGIAMLVIAVIVISSKLIFPIILMWIGCSIWAVKAVENYNKKIFSAVETQATVA